MSTVNINNADAIYFGDRPVDRVYLGMQRVWPPLTLTERVRALFDSADQGGMWDFTTAADLYQDDKGITPVMAAGQPVGLVLDRRFGLAREEELMTSPSTWTTEGTAQITDGKMVFTAAGSGDRVIGPIATVSGRTYEVHTVIEGSDGSVVMRTPFGTTVLNSGEQTFIAKATGSGSFRFTGHASVPTTAIVHSVSVREVPGNHLSQATTAARPTYTVDGAFHDGVDDFLVAANEGDWTFLHDGSGGALAVSLMVTDEEGSVGNKMVGTRNSSQGFRVGASNTATLPLLVNLLDANGDSISATGPSSGRGVWVRYVGESGGEGIRGYSNFGDTPLAPVTSWNQQEPQYPLRTLSAPAGRSTSIRRIIAISRVLTDTERAFVNAWLMEGVE